jgi:hypothetical protein
MPIKMICRDCGEVFCIDDETYKIQKQAEEIGMFTAPMYGGAQLRTHPFTCWCGGLLDE